MSVSTIIESRPKLVDIPGDVYKAFRKYYKTFKTQSAFLNATNMNKNTVNRILDQANKKVKTCSPDTLERVKEILSQANAA